MIKLQQDPGPSLFRRPFSENTPPGTLSVPHADDGAWPGPASDGACSTPAPASSRVPLSGTSRACASSACSAPNRPRPGTAGSAPPCAALPRRVGGSPLGSTDRASASPSADKALSSSSATALVVADDGLAVRSAHNVAGVPRGPITAGPVFSPIRADPRLDPAAASRRGSAPEDGGPSGPAPTSPAPPSPLHTSPSGRTGQAPTPRPPPSGAGARFPLQAPSGIGRGGATGRPATAHEGREARARRLPAGPPGSPSTPPPDSDADRTASREPPTWGDVPARPPRAVTPGLTLLCQEGKLALGGPSAILG